MTTVFVEDFKLFLELLLLCLKRTLHSTTALKSRVQERKLLDRIVHGILSDFQVCSNEGYGLRVRIRSTADFHFTLQRDKMVGPDPVGLLPP